MQESVDVFEAIQASSAINSNQTQRYVSISFNLKVRTGFILIQNLLTGKCFFQSKLTDLLKILFVLLHSSCGGLHHLVQFLHFWLRLRIKVKRVKCSVDFSFCFGYCSCDLK